MNTKYNIHKAKALICFCLFLTATCLTAQNTGSYKYILNTDGKQSLNMDVLEINSHYYLLSEVFEVFDFTIHRKSTVMITIFDENLNSIEQILLPEIGKGFFPKKLFYENNCFYIFGYTFVSEKTSKPCYAKLDKDFNLVQDVSIYAMDDNWSYDYLKNGILMTENQEFVFMVVPYRWGDARLFHISNEGDVLQEVSLPFGDWAAILVAADSHYLLVPARTETVLKISKDSFDRYEWVNIEKVNPEQSDGNAIVVNNQLITSNTYYGNDCKEDIGIAIDTDISIKFLNEDFSVKNRLRLGRYCIGDKWGGMHYLNPDSIYFAYGTSNAGESSAISIANFSSEGELNFDYTLDIPVPVDSFYYKLIFVCKAVSNGGVLVLGRVEDYSIDDDSPTMNGFLLLYHPTREDLGVENQLRITDYELRVFPNPTTGKLRVVSGDISDGTDKAIQICNVVGQVVFTSTMSTLFPETTIDISSLAKGMYFLRVGEKTVRFVKE